MLWNGTEPPRLVGSFRERIRLLLDNEVSLIAYHLPLDRHMELGNAAQLARRLGLVELEPFGDSRGVSVGVCGLFPEAVPAEELVEASDPLGTFFASGSDLLIMVILPVPATASAPLINRLVKTCSSSPGFPRI